MINLLAVVWDFNPVFLNLGGLEIRYYGLMWAMAIGIGWAFFINFVNREGLPEKVSYSIFIYGAISLIIGARLGHCLFYKPEFYLADPVKLLYIRDGGLSSHGGAIGLLVGLWLFSRHNKLPYLWSLDRIMIAIGIGGALIRLGNLFNSEIYGTPTDMPWGFIFVRAGETVAKHPTQIYEALFCLIMFAILLYLYYGKRDIGRRHPGLMFGVGLTIVFVSRFIIEYIKNPQVLFELDMNLLLGQWLSIPFIIIGVVFIVYGLRHEVVPAPIIPKEERKRRRQEEMEAEKRKKERQKSKNASKYNAKKK